MSSAATHCLNLLFVFFFGVVVCTSALKRGIGNCGGTCLVDDGTRERMCFCVSVCVWMDGLVKEVERERERDGSLLDPIPMMGFGCDVSWDFFYVPFRFVNPADFVSAFDQNDRGSLVESVM